MNRIRWYCENIASRDMLFKFPFLNMHQIPKFKKINLNLMTKTAIVDKKKNTSDSLWFRNDKWPKKSTNICTEINCIF
jgi:ribosomal protein L5